MTEPRALPAADEAAATAWDRAQGVATLLPALAVAWPGPGSLVAGDPLATELTAAGVAALSAVPAGLLLALRALRGLPFGLGPGRWLAALLGAALLSAAVVPASDPLERARSLLWIGTGLVLAVSAAHLRETGRRLLVLGAAACTLLLLAPALLAGDLSGVLQNTGELSNAALPGALAGAGLFALARGRLARALGLVALVLYLLHAFVAPVLAGLLSAAAVAGVAGALRWRPPGGRAAAQGLLVVAAAAAVGLVWIAAGRPAPGRAPVAPVAAAPASAELGGVEVRRRIAVSTLAMVADHPLLGVGPGQFAVAFPAYRDAREIELSSPFRGAGIETEVEHPHDDHLAILAELGILGALVWIAFAALVARAALRAARDGSATDLALALGALGILVVAFANGPLTYNPAASSLAFAFCGALLGPVRDASRALPARVAALALALGFVALAGPPALRCARHGAALARLAPEEPGSLRRASDAALEAAPDSVLGWTLRARALEAAREPRAEAIAAWERAVALRPHRIEALVQIGVHHALAGDRAAARARFEEAAALDPGHPTVLRNRVRLALTGGELERGLALLEELHGRGAAEPLWLRDLGCELLARGLDREAAGPLPLADPRFAALDAGEALRIAEDYRAAGSPLAADGFETQANRLWAEEHAAAGRWDDARRMLRQALRVSRDYVPGGGARLRMELAASMWESERRDEARQELEGLVFDAADWESVPDWTRAALTEMAVLPPR